jgi:Hsp33 protein
LLESTPVRGEIAHLDATWRAVLERRAYPAPLERLLGEMMAAAALLSATLKFEGSLIMQMQGSGPVQLLVVEATSEQTLRATAKWDGDLAQGNVTELLGAGRFVISIVPSSGKQAYQGIVSIEGESIAQVLEHYMAKSEQLETRLWLASDSQQAAGMLLQKLPATPSQDADAWAKPSSPKNCLRFLRPKSSAVSITRRTCAYSSRVRLRSAAPARTSASRPCCACSGTMKCAPSSMSAATSKSTANSVAGTMSSTRLMRSRCSPRMSSCRQIGRATERRAQDAGRQRRCSNCE